MRRHTDPGLKQFLACLGVLVFSLSPGGCANSKPAPGPMRRYRIEGEILKTDSADQTATIRHKDIEGWMHAMTMDYPIRKKEDFSQLHAGDHITGTVYVQDEDFSVGDIHVTSQHVTSQHVTSQQPTPQQPTPQQPTPQQPTPQQPTPQQPTPPK